MERDVKLVKRGKCRNLKLKQLCPEIKVKNKDIGKKNFCKLAKQKIGTAAVPAVPKGSMESINFLGGPARVASDMYEYEKALCVQV